MPSTRWIHAEPVSGCRIWDGKTGLTGGAKVSAMRHTQGTANIDAKLSEMPPIRALV